jgi:hypothetical protein
MPGPKVVPISELAETLKAHVIDEYGDLDQKVRAFAPAKKRHKLLEDQIQSWLPPQHPADKPITFVGRLYDVTVGIAEERRRITSMTKVLYALRKAKISAAGVVTATLKALEQAFGVEKAAQFVVKERTGPRDVIAVRRPEAA